ncbi:MAG: hypothetical protein ACJ77A_03670 [Actinomycetota bacterium]
MRVGRISLLLAIAWTCLCACGHHGATVSTQREAVRQISAGRALNATPGAYRAGGVDITLVKVVSLPGDRLGMQFSFHSPGLPPGSCCSLFPREGLAGGRPVPRGTTFTTFVVEERSSVGDRGTLRLSLFGGRPVRRVGSFTVDLPALRATGFAASGA